PRAGAAPHALRRAAAALERAARQHEPGQPAADPPCLLRGALRADPAVLAAARRRARHDRVRATPDDARDILVGEARARPRVHRGPLGGPLLQGRRGDRLAGLEEPVPRAGLEFKLGAHLMCGICGLVSLAGESVDANGAAGMNET